MNTPFDSFDGAVTTAPVRSGPRALRQSLRRFGAPMGLVAPALLTLASAILRAGEAGRVRGGLAYLATLCAAPGLIATGTPVNGGTGRVVAGYALSALLWLSLGALAAGRATRSPVATWRDWRREYAWLCVPVWAGTLMALGVAGALLLL